MLPPVCVCARVVSGPSCNSSQVNSCQAAWATHKQPEQAHRADELSDFSWELRKHE